MQIKFISSGTPKTRKYLPPYARILLMAIKSMVEKQSKNIPYYELFLLIDPKTDAHLSTLANSITQLANIGFIELQL